MSRKFHSNNDSLSMLHLNIRSIPDYFLQLTSLQNNLNIELKIVAISQTWIKPFHINYNIPNYNIEQDFHLQKRGGGVCLYLHSVIQYNLRNDLQIGNDPELVNSVFVEIEGTKNVNVGCIYRPPWVDVCTFNVLLNNNLLDSLHGP